MSDVSLSKIFEVVKLKKNKNCSSCKQKNILRYFNNHRFSVLQFTKVTRFKIAI